MQQDNPTAQSHIHENKRLVINRLSRALGHLEKVRRMVEEDYDCAEILTQLAAVRGALVNTGKIIMQDHIQNCIADAIEDGDEAAMLELYDAIDKFIK